MKKKDDFQLGINPRPINETEERQLSLLLNLIRNRQGLSFLQIRQIMKEYYSNTNIESDQKKLQRDIDELKENGFSIKFYKIFHETMEYNVYKIDEAKKNARIEMSEEELKQFSFLVLKKSEENLSNDLFTASQKIFSRNLQHFPGIKKKTGNDANIEKGESQISQVLYKIMTAIKNRTPLRIEYFKTNSRESYLRDIEPLQIIKRNSEDFYLIVYDREKKQKRRFLIPKILKAFEISGEFLFAGKITENDLNYHVLNFSVHDPETLEITCNPENSWKLEKYLYPHPFKKIGDTFLFKTTNRSGLFNFIIKENDCIEKINSKDFIRELQEFINRIKYKYSLI